jgi:chromosomal replication initiation ATPase DnaA
MAVQIPLPLPATVRLGRADFITGPGNAAAVAFVDAWPDWTAPAAVLYGPTGSGKSHLAGIWAERAGATTLAASALADEWLTATAPLVIEDINAAPLGLEREAVLFALLERGHALVLTAEQPPASWTPEIPDLISRFAALLALPLWAPDDALLEGLARKLFADRQVQVPDAVIVQMIRALERSPGAVRDFVARADSAALAEKRAISLSLIRELLNDA